MKAVTLFLIFGFAPMAHAHHNFRSEFDGFAPVKVTGKVTKVELINPHSWIHLDVEEKGKPVKKWMFEAGTPNTLLRAGVTKDTLKIGTVIVARGYQSRDKKCKPACKANGRDLRLPDGKLIFIKAPEDAAKDGKDSDFDKLPE